MDKQYERNIIVAATEDFMVMTTAKIPAGVTLKQILIAPSENNFSPYLQMFVSMDTEVIYSGQFLADGINVSIEDGGYDEERLLMFSLSCNLCPLEIQELLHESFFRVKILGDYVDGYAVVDDSVSTFDTEFLISWA
jgi:hypothetical protein|tara:strand:- start:2993 stop:3403 length:411 start_codon:yes stop_codon:yes gene_type:complete